MFATLIINLPSKHSGGELVVRFDGKEEVIDFSESSAYEMPFVAFYADSEHEIKPLKSGNRICLVYNLLFSRGCEVASPKYSKQSEQISSVLQKIEKKDTLQFPKAVFLEHEYTPVNFKLSNLKQHDFPRAKALLYAAEKAGYFAKLGLVTHYKMGELESDDYDYYGRGGDYLIDSSMGEIYEQYTTIENWGNGIIPDLGELQISE